MRNPSEDLDISDGDLITAQQGCQAWIQIVKLTQNRTNLGLFKISFSTFWLAEPNCTETDLKKSKICPILGQSDPI